MKQIKQNLRYISLTAVMLFVVACGGNQAPQLEAAGVEMPTETSIDLNDGGWAIAGANLSLGATLSSEVDVKQGNGIVVYTFTETVELSPHEAQVFDLGTEAVGRSEQTVTVTQYEPYALPASLANNIAMQVTPGADLWSVTNIKRSGGLATMATATSETRFHEIVFIGSGESEGGLTTQGKWSEANRERLEDNWRWLRYNGGISGNHKIPDGPNAKTINLNWTIDGESLKPELDRSFMMRERACAFWGLGPCHTVREQGFFWDANKRVMFQAAVNSGKLGSKWGKRTDMMLLSDIHSSKFSTAFISYDRALHPFHHDPEKITVSVQNPNDDEFKMSHSYSSFSRLSTVGLQTQVLCNYAPSNNAKHCPRDPAHPSPYTCYDGCDIEEHALKRAADAHFRHQTEAEPVATWAVGGTLVNTGLCLYNARKLKFAKALEKCRVAVSSAVGAGAAGAAAVTTGERLEAAYERALVEFTDCSTGFQCPDEPKPIEGPISFSTDSPLQYLGSAIGE